MALVAPYSFLAPFHNKPVTPRFTGWAKIRADSGQVEAPDRVLRPKLAGEPAVVAHRMAPAAPQQARQMARDLWPRTVRHPVTFVTSGLLPTARRSPIFMRAIPPLLACKGF